MAFPLQAHAHGAAHWNAAVIRARTCESASWLGSEWTSSLNERGDEIICGDDSAIGVLVIPTAEELASLGTAKPGAIDCAIKVRGIDCVRCLPGRPMGMRERNLYGYDTLKWGIGTVNVRAA